MCERVKSHGKTNRFLCQARLQKNAQDRYAQTSLQEYSASISSSNIAGGSVGGLARSVAGSMGLAARFQTQHELLAASIKSGGGSSASAAAAGSGSGGTGGSKTSAAGSRGGGASTTKRSKWDQPP